MRSMPRSRVDGTKSLSLIAIDRVVSLDIAGTHSGEGMLDFLTGQDRRSASNGNEIISTLSAECRDFLDERSLTKPIISGEVLHEAEAPLHALIFPHEGLVSLQYKGQDGRTAEILAVGVEGAVGIEYMLGSDHSPFFSVTVISGRATWVPVGDVAEALERFSCVRPALQTYVNMRMRHLMQIAACASLHNASQRLSTWLLQAEDRSHAMIFDITQRMLADILGFRLATISDGCSKLLDAGAINYSRGRLQIVDRTVLENQACECYEALR